MPLAIEQLDLSDYDLIISSSYAVAKGVITGPDQLHISYVHSPIRYAWDLQHAYLREAGFDRGLRSIFARLILHYIRLWDYRTGAGPDVLIANSHFVARRIRKIYGREAVVIPPPVDVDKFVPGISKEEFYLTASRMVPYKCIPLIVEAFAAMPDKRLVVIGDGPDMPAVRKRAASAKNIEILGYQPEQNSTGLHAARASICIRSRGGFWDRSAGGASMWHASDCAGKRWCAGNGERT